MSRYAAYAASLVMFLVSLLLALRMPGWWWGVAVFGALALLGTLDLLQSRTTLRRNYPILAHVRYGLESIGPELRQYFAAPPNVFDRFILAREDDLKGAVETLNARLKSAMKKADHIDRLSRSLVGKIALRLVR